MVPVPGGVPPANNYLFLPVHGGSTVQTLLPRRTMHIIHIRDTYYIGDTLVPVDCRP